MDFTGKVVIISGAAEGIGAACAYEFRRRGAKLALVDVVVPKDLGSDDDVLWIQGDVSDPSLCEQVVKGTLDRFGAIDILINNAGVGIYASAADTPIALARRIFEVNVFGPLALTASAFAYIRKRPGGAVVNLSSICGLVPTPWNAMYCASKSAMHSFSRALRLEAAIAGVHVLTVVPGIVRTGFREHVLAGEAPPNVLKIDSSISANELAVAIANGVLKRKSILFKPRRGILFYAIDLFAPAVMDWFLLRCWSASVETSPRRDPHSCSPNRNDTSSSISGRSLDR